MNKILKLIRFWLPVFVWAILIFAFSSFPTPKTSQVDWQDFVVKKIAHLTEYAIFSVLVYRALRNTVIASRKKLLFWSLLLVFLYAVVDEFHQTFVISRQGTLRDILVDFIGAGLACLWIWKYLPKAPQRLKSWAQGWQII